MEECSMCRAGGERVRLREMEAMEDQGGRRRERMVMEAVTDEAEEGTGEALGAVEEGMDPERLHLATGGEASGHREAQGMEIGEEDMDLDAADLTRSKMSQKVHVSKALRRTQIRCQ